MKTKKPTYTISYYRTTNGIFPTMTLGYVSTLGVVIKIESWKPYKTDAGAKRGIIRLARKMGLLSKVQERGCGGSVQ